MKLRVVDYEGSPGGGTRFVTELAAAVHGLHPEWTLELVSAGEALTRYRELFAGSPWMGIRAVPWRRGPYPLRRVAGIPGSGRVRSAVRQMMGGAAYGWAYEVPEAAYEGCDVCFFPWVQRHRIAALRAPTVGTLHDVIFLLTSDASITEAQRGKEREALARWLASEALLATGSRATLETVRRLFGAREERLHLIPPSFHHALPRPEAAGAIPATWDWMRERFLLYAANTSPHKNHETLFRGIAAWGRGVPLVLTGYGTDDVVSVRGERGKALRALAEREGLSVGRDILPLGYVGEDALAAVNRAAWAACVPSLAEGGGSFPAQEALLAGVPLVCSDLPVLREQFDGTGAPVLWFDPQDPAALAARLRELESRYGTVRDAVRQAADVLRRRTWRDVAAAYARLFETAAARRR